jgi:hypothetical protein
MIHAIVTTPAAQALYASGGSVTDVVAEAGIPLTLIVIWHVWLRRYMYRKVVHFFDLLTVLLALDVGVVLATTWPGQWAHSLFGWIAAKWNGAGNTGGSKWATIAALALVGFLIAAIVKISKQQHQGPLGTVLVMMALVPVVLVATQGTFGHDTMRVVTALAHPTAFRNW